MRAALPGLALLALVALAPFALSGAGVNFLLSSLIVALAAQGWNILGGYAGQLSFGHAAFFGTGAYATALLQVRYGANAWAALAAGIALGAAVGWVIGALSFRARLRGSYFALVTLAFAEVLRILANAADWTGGAAGVLVRLSPGVSNLQFADRAAFLWLLVACVAAALLLTAWIARGRFGARLVAVRENEDAAAAIGIDAFRVKVTAMVLSGAVAGAAGVAYLQTQLFVDSSIAFGSLISVEALLGPIIGGAGTLLGPVIGTLLLHVLGEGVKGVIGGAPGLNLVVYGAVLLLILRFLPHGLMGVAEWPFRRRRAPAAEGP